MGSGVEGSGAYVWTCCSWEASKQRLPKRRRKEGILTSIMSLTIEVSEQSSLAYPSHLPPPHFFIISLSLRYSAQKLVFELWGLAGLWKREQLVLDW